MAVQGGAWNGVNEVLSRPRALAMATSCGLSRSPSPRECDVTFHYYKLKGQSSTANYPWSIDHKGLFAENNWRSIVVMLAVDQGDLSSRSMLSYFTCGNASW